MVDNEIATGLEQHMGDVARLQLDTFRHLEPQALVLDRIWRKRFSLVHRYRIEGNAGTDAFFVKGPLASAEQSGVDRARLVNVHPDASRAVLLGEAMHDLWAAVDGAGRSDLGAVRLLPGSDHRVVAMTAARGEPLRELVTRQVRWRRPHRDLDAVFQRAGVLLRLFHERVLRPGVPEALVDRDQVVADAVDLVAYLGATTSAGRALAETGPRLVAAIEMHLPKHLATVTRFGDFGLTNLLVDQDGTVTAIDTLGGLRTPPIHDATYFVTAITSLRSQLVSRDLSISPPTVEGWLRSFWNGYLGGRPIPQAAVEVWCCLRLLERWAAKSLRRASGLSGLTTGLVLDRPMIALINRSLGVAERCEPQPALVNTLVTS